MRLREALREGWRDVCSGASGAAISALVFAVLVGAVVWAGAMSSAAEVRAAHHWVASGAATIVVAADGRIAGASCDALAEMPSVLAAGALRRVADGIVPSALPRTSIPTFETTSGFDAVIGAHGMSAPSTSTPSTSTDGASAHGTSTVGAGDARKAAATGVVLARQASEELGVHPSDRLHTTTGGTDVAGTYDHPDDGRDPELAYAALERSIDDGRPFDACWVTIWPSDDDAQAAARRTVLPSTGAPDEDRVTISQLNGTLGTAFDDRADPTAALRERGGAGAIGAVLGSVAVLRRRLSIASDRHVGVPLRAQSASTVLQHLVWALVGSSAVLAGVVLVARGLAAADAGPIVLDAAISTGTGVGGVVIGGAIGLVLVRERALHRYFRTR